MKKLEKTIQKISRVFFRNEECLDFCCVRCVCPMERHQNRKDVIICHGCNRMILVKRSKK